MKVMLRTPRPLLWAGLFASVVVIAGLAIMLAAKPTLPEPPAGFDTNWPPFTMVYEVPGERFQIEDEVIETREIHRLTWNAPDDWYDETTEADSITLPDLYPPLSSVGSWKSFDGETFTRHFGDTGTTVALSREAMTPHAILAPYRIYDAVKPYMDDPVTADRSAGSIPVTVCYRSDCSQGVEAVAIGKVGNPFVFTPRGIPLQAPGDLFTDH